MAYLFTAWALPILMLSSWYTLKMRTRSQYSPDQNFQWFPSLLGKKIQNLYWTYQCLQVLILGQLRDLISYPTLLINFLQFLYAGFCPRVFALAIFYTRSSLFNLKMTFPFNLSKFLLRWYFSTNTLLQLYQT